MQFAVKFDADNPPEWQFRRHQQHAPLAGAEINEGEIFILDLNSAQQFVELPWPARRVFVGVNPIFTLSSQFVRFNGSLSLHSKLGVEFTIQT